MPISGRAICLNCGERDVDLGAGWDWPGERVLIDRASLSFRAPRRWETLVFRCPERADTYCVKRVVGLPGETVEIRAGDVYINGQIARKNLPECLAVAQLVHDATFAPQSDFRAQDRPGWRGSEPESRWRRSATGAFEFPLAKGGAASAVGTDVQDGVRLDWLEFRAARDRPLTDDDAYNQSESRRLNLVSDVMLRCELSLAGPGELVVRTDVAGERFEVRLAPGRRLAILSRGGEELQCIELTEASFASPTWLELIRFDQQILLAIGGTLVLRQEFSPFDAATAADHSETEQRPGASGRLGSNVAPPWAIGASELQVRVGHLQLFRDIYYTPPALGWTGWGDGQPVGLSEREYFLLGDNSPISADSRVWTRPGLEQKLLVGRLMATW